MRYSPTSGGSGSARAVSTYIGMGLSRLVARNCRSLAPVLAQAPALTFEAAFVQRSLQVDSGRAGVALGGKIELSEMPADVVLFMMSKPDIRLVGTTL